MTVYVNVGVGDAGWGMTGVESVIALTDPRDSLKALRETLCRVQGDISSHWFEYGSTDDPIEPHVERIQRIIDEIDRQRPLGSDGKHDNLHTATCGCIDRSV